jgi:hypothetical protein
MMTREARCDGVHICTDNHAEDNRDDKKHNGCARHIGGRVASRNSCWADLSLGVTASLSLGEKSAIKNSAG